MEKKFKPFDKVLIRRNWLKEWMCDFYSHYDEEVKRHRCVGNGWVSDENILPYEGNEHLVGRVDEPDEEVRLEEGEYLMGCCEIELEHPQYWNIGKYVKGLHKDCFLTDCGSYIYAVKFSDFNPNDMEETSRHILCVKNGKVVKYKG